MELDWYWKRLRGEPKPPEEPRVRGWDLKRSITQAATKADEELRVRLQESQVAANVPLEVCSRIATTAVQCFLEAWYDELRGGDTVSLIGVVLDGADMTPTELKDFVRALPETLLQRICDFPTPTASGIQALLAIEHRFRKDRRTDYLLNRDVLDGKLMVTFHPPEALGVPITFKLDETFEGVQYSGFAW